LSDRESRATIEKFKGKEGERGGARIVKRLRP